MRAPRDWLSLMAFVAATLAPAVVAQECRPETASLSVRNETAFKNLSDNCPTFVGYAYFNTNFTETFVLPKITRFEGTIELSSNDVVKSIEFPDLEYLESLFALTGFPNLRRISMPKLRNVDSIHLELESPEVVVEYPSLENAQGIFLRGNWTSVKFPKLREVNGSLSICQSDNCSARPGKPPMDISLPVLEQVNDDFEVGGNVSSLSAPKLAKSGTFHFGSEFGGNMVINNFGEPLNVSLPHLTAVNGIMIRGNISDVVLPLLQDEIHGTLIYSENELSISLPMEDLGDTTLSGPIDSVQFPNIKTFRSIYVDSESVLDCGALKKDIEKAMGQIGEDQSFTCSGKDAGGLSTGAKAGIGVGVGVGGLLLIALGFFLWKRRASAKRGK